MQVEKKAKRFPCKHAGCSQTFSTSGHLSRHMKIHSGEKPHVCFIQNCQSSFARKDNMMQHFAAHRKKFLMRNEPVPLKMEAPTFAHCIPSPATPPLEYPVYTPYPIRDFDPRRTSLCTPPLDDYFKLRSTSSPSILTPPVMMNSPLNLNSPNMNYDFMMDPFQDLMYLQ